MSRKRKASKIPTSDVRHSKSQKCWSLQTPDRGHDEEYIDHPVLSCYYPQVMTLRSFILSRLPQSSRVRKRKISASNGVDQLPAECRSFLDATLIGVLQGPDPNLEETRKKQFIVFTQSQSRLIASGDEDGQGCNVAEIVDFAIWLLFHKASGATRRPRHILCQGFQRSALLRSDEELVDHTQRIPGVVSEHPNENVQMLKKTPWTEIMSVLGDSGEAVVKSLLLDCGIFTLLGTGKENFYQLSGVPISDLLPSETPKTINGPRSLQTKAGGKGLKDLHPAREIAFVRHRMLYAKPSLNGRREICFGLKHIHVLNRYPDFTNMEHTVHIMKYVFPRQFGLHNVFTSSVDTLETVQPLKDYTLREHEIAEEKLKGSRKIYPQDEHGSRPPSLPKRLRGAAFALVKKIQSRHQRCPYSALLRYYCSAGPAATTFFRTSSIDPSRPPKEPVSDQSLLLESQSILTLPISSHTKPVSDATRDPHSSVMEYATPSSQVSAFCQSVVRHLLPRNALGTEVEGSSNMRKLFQNIDLFIELRRFESVTLHQVSQNLKLKTVHWLRPPKMSSDAYMCDSDRKKRSQILAEFIYYIFDSILIPLIRSNFYVTESGVHRNRLFFFRHDIWRKISDPSLAQLRLTMYEGIKPDTTRKILASRSLGYSSVRLLPKISGTRPIINLRRRVLQKFSGRQILTSSINAQLGGVFSVLNYERHQQSSKLGSALFSVGDLHSKLGRFKTSLGNLEKTRLYFVKVDIQSCFDSIPQQELMAMVVDLLGEDEYRTTKYSETKPTERSSNTNRKPRRKFVGTAIPANDQAAFSESIASSLASYKKRMIFADTGNQRKWQTSQLLKLLHEHVQNNMVKMGKRHFRQKKGIPQGSVLSSLLCSFFYGAFECEWLPFLDAKTSLLLRLIDDFLLITTNPQVAGQFLDAMAIGSGSYGITVNPEKSLVNFDVTINGHKVPRHHGSPRFPYCGIAIDMKTLQISRGKEKRDLRVSNGLTIERSRSTGLAFRRKTLASFKIQLHAMLIDTSHNGTGQVMCSLYESFTETGIKLHQYCRGLRSAQRPSQTLILEVIHDLINLANGLIQAKTKSTVVPTFACKISRAQLTWLAAAALEQVFLRKQSQYSKVLRWLIDVKLSVESRMQTDRKTLGTIVREGARAFQDHVF